NMVQVMKRCASLFLKRTSFTLEIKTLCPYHKRVVDHYENPRNVGSLDKNAKNVGTGLVGGPACGGVMKLQIQVDVKGKIVDARFKTFGCGSAIASSSLVTEWAKGKSIDEALKIKNTDISVKQTDTTIGTWSNTYSALLQKVFIPLDLFHILLQPEFKVRDTI
uniref:Iron-sulfur cluster assembly enzyme a n=1 Tax=Salmo trutta TaxID=8032 RepID=A0A674BND8_SALTR